MKSPKGMATLVGSLPHTDPERAMRLILQTAPEAPIWPQLPKRHWREGFLTQYAGGIPCILENPENGSVAVSRASGEFPDALTSFYEAAMAAPDTGDFSRFEMDAGTSAGIPAAMEALGRLSRKPPYVKVQTTGPLSFALHVLDETGMPLYYDDTYADVVLQNMIMKSLWQVRLFRPYAERVICFIDEPVLFSFGSSSYINLTREGVVSTLSAVTGALHGEDALVGVHVCGNTEWTMLIDAGVDIISFDAYAYGESMALYGRAVDGFLRGGGVIAWGIVPTGPAVREESVQSLERRLIHSVNHLADQGPDIDLIWQQSMITPSCGMGTMSEDDAELVMSLVSQLSAVFTKRLRQER